jgi:hypothetical protein
MSERIEVISEGVIVEDVNIPERDLVDDICAKLFAVRTRVDDALIDRLERREYLLALDKLDEAVMWLQRGKSKMRVVVEEREEKCPPIDRRPNSWWKITK